MQISLKLIQAINHAKSTVCIKFELLVTFGCLFTGSSSLSVFPRGVLYDSKEIFFLIFKIIQIQKVGYVLETVFHAKSNGASFKVRKLTIFKQQSFEVVEYAN